ncbi:MAG: cytochrome c [Coriobacteriaceae bacterium]|mgnify:CR=1 FL=1|nr:cytochrome c [Coriobacteriaceae bacterium]
MIGKKVSLKPVSVLFAGILMFFGLLSLTACGSNTPDPKELYEDKCSACHGLGIVESAPYSSLEEWQAMVDRMQDKNRSFSDTEAKAIAEYLNENMK